MFSSTYFISKRGLYSILEVERVIPFPDVRFVSMHFTTDAENIFVLPAE